MSGKGEKRAKVTGVWPKRRWWGRVTLLCVPLFLIEGGVGLRDILCKDMVVRDYTMK